MTTKRRFIKHLPLVLAGLALGLGVFINTNLRSHVVAQQSDAADYYNGVTDSMTGTTLLNKLNTIINTSSVSVSYDWSRYKAADEDPNNNSNIIAVYSRRSIPKSSTDPGQEGDYWNREHTFPNSKITGKAESDNHIIYASEKKVNGARSSLKMGVVNNGTVVNDNNGNATTCQKTSSLFDPNNVARGIVARTTMYAAVMYGLEPTDNFESVATMLRWHLEYQPDANDVRRNNTVYSNQNNRNPFVDHPEYACRIWGSTNNTTQSICNAAGSVSISESSKSIEVGNTFAVSATSSDNSTISWSSDDTSVATVSAATANSGTSITVEGVGAGTATITASATISGNTYSATCSVTATSSGSQSGDSDSYDISYTDLDTSVYPTTAKTYTSASGISFTAFNTANFSSKVQFKKSGGYIYNNSSLDLGTLTINGLSGTVTVYGGSSSNPSSTTISGTNGVYNLTGHKYFKIINNSGSVATCDSITVGIASSSQSQVTSISASVSKTYYVGETISSSDITVKDNNNTVVSTFTFENDGYQFKYSDASSGGALTNKTFTNAISGSEKTCSLTVQVQRKARVAPSAGSYSVSYSDLPTAYDASSNVRTASSGLKFIAYNLAHYSNNKKMQFKGSEGYLKTTEALNLSTLTINNRESNTLTVSGSTNGSSFTNISGSNDVYNLSGYSYVKVARTSSGAAYCTDILITTSGGDTAVSLSNYIMYEDTNNQCNTKLGTAIGYLSEMSSSERSSFSSSNDYVISTARTRLEAWAASKGKTINYNNGSLSPLNTLVSSIDNVNNNIIIVLVLLSLVGLTAIGAHGYIQIKRNKE